MILFQYAGIVKNPSKKVFNHLEAKETLESEMQEALNAYCEMFVECEHNLSTEEFLGLTLHEKKALRIAKNTNFKNREGLKAMLGDPDSRKAVMDPEGFIRDKIKFALKASVERLAEKKYFNG